LGARFLFDFAFRAIATASFEPWQQRQSPVCLLTICAFVGTDPTITSGSAVIRADQQLLGHFGKRRAACVSVQSAHCCI
jgi:hypothetical protein